jgi:aspartate racemase
MKTIGLVGGMSWTSSLEYYRIINEEVQKKLGELRSAKIILNSVDFRDFVLFSQEGRWDEVARLLTEAAQVVEKAGADFALLCTNTAHKMADQVQNNLNIPLLHIGDAVGECITEMGLKKVGLLGTKYTMQEDFYKGRLAERFDITTVVPNQEEIKIVNDVIFKELCLGEIKTSSRDEFVEIIQNLEKNGAQGVILGCTEIPLLVKNEYVSIPLFDTTTIHAKAAVELALK